jgi:hypothetical protein
VLEGFRAIIDGDEPPPPGARAPDAEELCRALQVLLKGQVIYAETQGIGRSYELARHYAPFFTDYFACLGYALTVSHRDQMVSLSPAADAPRHDIVSERLRKDETLVLLALRLLYEEGLRDHRAGTDGIVDCTTDEIVEKIRAVARNEPPEEGRLADILRLYAKRGGLRLGERDRVERVTPLSLLPGVTVLASDAWMERLRAWSEAGEA